MTKEYWLKKINEETSDFLEKMFKLVQDDFDRMYQKSVKELNIKQDNLNKQVGTLLGQKDDIEKRVKDVDLELRGRLNKKTELENDIIKLTEENGKLYEKSKKLLSKINDIEEREKIILEKEAKLEKKEEELGIKESILNDKEKTLKRIYNG